MTKEDILKLRDTAEQTQVQFKERMSRDNKRDTGTGSLSHLFVSMAEADGYIHPNETEIINHIWVEEKTL